MLEHDLAALKAAPPDVALTGLEAAVWRRIEAHRAARVEIVRLVPVRALAVAGALVIGGASGWLSAAATLRDTNEVSAFSTEARLAPSTLLAGRE